MNEKINDEIQKKGLLDRLQDHFYEKQSDFETYIIYLSIGTIMSMTFWLGISSLSKDFYLYSSIPFVFLFFLMAISSIVYFIASTFFWKRKTEKKLENAKGFKEKCFKYTYYGIKYVIGLSFVLTFLGDFIFSLIFERSVNLINEGYNQISVRLLTYAILLIVSYCAIVIFNFTARLLGLGELISKNNSLSMESKRSFVTFIGGFFIMVTLLFSSLIFDSRVSVILTETTNKLAQTQKNYRGY